MKIPSGSYVSSGKKTQLLPQKTITICELSKFEAQLVKSLVVVGFSRQEAIQQIVANGRAENIP